MPESPRRRSILFLCTANSCRSQMAEGWARHLLADFCDPFSAGVRPSQVNPLAVAVMGEAGVDLSGHRSKHVDELAGVDFDLVITVCDNARDACPVLPQARRVIHVPFDDPPRLAAAETDDEARLAHYRRVRDQIREMVEALPRRLDNTRGQQG